MRTSKTRHQFYLPDALSVKLDALAAAPGASKTAILSEALTAWLERGAARDLDERFGPRLDRISRREERIEHKIDLITEALGLFIQHQLTLVAHQPPFDRETGRLGADRYRRFLEQVGRRMAKRSGEEIAAQPAREDV